MTMGAKAMHSCTGREIGAQGESGGATIAEDTERDDAQLQDAVRNITRRLRSLEKVWPSGLALDSIDGVLVLQARERAPCFAKRCKADREQ